MFSIQKRGGVGIKKSVRVHCLKIVIHVSDLTS